MFPRILSAACVWLLLASSVGAQMTPIPPIRRKPPMMGGGGLAVPLAQSYEGTVDVVAAGRIQITTTNGQAIVLVRAGMTKVQLTGTGTTELLKPPVCVEFTAEVDKGSKVKEKVTQLTAFTQSADKPLGLFPPGAISEIGGAIEGALPGAGGTGGAGAKPGKKTGAGGTGSAGGTQLPATYTVRGQVKTFHGTSLTINTGRGTMKVELDENCEIKVETTDFTKATRGDKITVTGQAMTNNTIQAATVKIEAAQPLVGKKKPGKADKPSTKQTAPGKKGAPEEEAADASGEEPPPKAKAKAKKAPAQE
jgi:hypothetical protein